MTNAPMFKLLYKITELEFVDSYIYLGQQESFANKEAEMELRATLI